MYALKKLTAGFCKKNQHNCHIAAAAKRKKATPKRSGFSHLFSAKKYLETRYGQHLTHFNVVGVAADSGLVGLVYLVPFGGVAVLVFSNF